MRFRYIGEAPNGSIEQYGVRFIPGQASEVTDELAVKKLLGNRFFEALGQDVPTDHPQPKRRGRPPKVRPESTIDSHDIE